jgi:hypothetical protein
MRRRLVPFALALTALASPGVAEAQPVALFPSRAELAVPVPGVVRVVLPDEVLEASGPTFADLRVLDAAGEALPYVVDGAPSSGELVTDLGALTPVEARQQAAHDEGDVPTFREVYELELPLETASTGTRILAMAVASPHFTANATVERVAPDAEPEPLTARSVFRLPSGAEQLEITLPAEASGRIRITLVGEMGLLSPLFELKVALPPQSSDLRSVIFDATRAHRPLYLYFGGGRVLAPSYPEAEALLAAARTASLAGAGAAGPVVPNPSYSDEPALGFAMVRGPTVDVAAFAHRAEVTIGASPEGLSRIVLPSAVEAQIDPAHEDLRLVDGEGRQWPYLRGLEDEEARLPLVVHRHRTPPGRSRYGLSLPDGPANVRAILVDLPNEYVDRAYRILQRRDDGQDDVWGEGRLARRPGETGPIRLAVGRDHADAFELEVTDGDDAPIAPAITAVVAHRVLFAAAPKGTYRLLFGVAPSALGAAPPRYEIELARSLVVALPSVDAEVGAAMANPDFDPPSTYSRSKLWDLLLWLVLGFAIIALGALTFRLARAATPPEDPDDV